MKIIFTDVKTLGYHVDTEKLRPLGDVVVYDDLEDDNLSDVIKDANVIIVNHNHLAQHNLEEMTDLKLICQAGTGYDNIDVEYCRKKGIAVANVPSYAGTSVAQHTFAMLFHLISHSGYYDDYVKSGKYSLKDQPTHTENEFFELEGKTWGIIGLGDIGSKVAAHATEFGCKVVYTPIVSKTLHKIYENLPFESLLEVSDIISIHAPLSPLTENLFTIKELKKMKPNAVLLNLGRGGIVNESDLAKALNEHIISSAGLDVLEKEPMEANHPLLHLDEQNRVYITPHIAYGSIEARERLMAAIYANIRAFIIGERLNRVD